MHTKHLSFLALVAFAMLTGSALADEKHHHHKGGKDSHVAAIGIPGDASNVSRTINVQLNDTMRFAPDRLTATRNETIRFVVRNGGKVKHEMILGSPKELKKHAELMRKHPEMEHADPNQVSVDPGQTGELVWRFTRVGNVDFECLHPGHFDAGMVGKVAVR